MFIKPLPGVAAAMCALALAACGQSNDSTIKVDDGDGLDSPKPALTRIHLASVEFSKWVDYVQLDAVLITPEAEDAESCKIKMPVQDNTTTVWKPIQVFWVHYDEHADMVPAIENTYYEGEKLSATDFSRDGASAVGLRPLSSLNKMFVDIENVRLSQEDTILSADITLRSKLATIDDGINPIKEIAIPSKALTIKALIRNTFEDGECKAKTNFCVAEHECVGEGDMEQFAERDLNVIYLEQNALYFTKNAILR